MPTRRLALAAILTALLVLPAGTGARAAAPEEVIRKAESAERNVSYRGIKWTNLHVSGRIVRANYKIVHLKPDATRVDYFGPPEIAGITTITRGSGNWRYLPKKGEWERQKWELEADRAELATKNYRLVDGGSDTVAGRPAHVFKFLPKKSGSPSQTVWVDKQHFLVLRSETRTANGELRSASAFTEIRFNPSDIKASAFEVPTLGPEKGQAGKLDFPVAKPSYMPSGYKLVDINSISVGGDRAAHLKYTNGLNTISIFQRKGNKSPKEMENLLKVLPTGVRLHTFTRDGATFTIIGDIDKKEIDKIAKSIRL